jgi:hypothetical protein
MFLRNLGTERKQTLRSIFIGYWIGHRWGKIGSSMCTRPQVSRTAHAAQHSKQWSEALPSNHPMTHPLLREGRMQKGGVSVAQPCGSRNAVSPNPSATPPTQRKSGWNDCSDSGVCPQRGGGVDGLFEATKEMTSWNVRGSASENCK